MNKKWLKSLITVALMVMTVLSLSLTVFAASAPTVDTGKTAYDLAQTLFAESGANISDASKTGTVSYITNAESLVGMESCIMLDTSGSSSGSNDPDLAQLISSLGNSYGGHTSSLQFTMTATDNLLNFNYVFASTEFNQSAKYNDVFALFVSCNDGPFENIALLSNGKPVTITNLRAGINGTQMSSGTSTSIGSSGTEYDYFSVIDKVVTPSGTTCNGITNMLTAQKQVNVGDKVTLKFVIADVGDTSFNSYVAIECGSIQFAHAELGKTELMSDKDNPGIIHVDQAFTDSRVGDSISLNYCINGGETTTLNTITNKTALEQSIGGLIDMSDYADDEYELKFWLYNNSNNTVSDSVTRTVTVKDGKIVDGLDRAALNVNVQVNGTDWDTANQELLIGNTLDEAKPNGSALPNGTYNVYFRDHLIGNATVNGGYTEQTIAWEKLGIISFTTPGTSIYKGTSALDVELPTNIYAWTDQGYKISLGVKWTHTSEVYNNEGLVMIAGTPTVVEGFEGFSAEELFTFPDAHLSATINVLHVHSYSNVTIDPTCTTPGVNKDVCECGDEINVSYIPSLGHSYASEVIREATCSQDGIIKYTCTNENCGYYYTVTTHTEHNYVMTVIEPTCTEDGATVYTCSKCGSINKISIPASHSYTSEVTKVATRYEDGEIKYTCSKCGDFYTEVIPASNANVLVIQDRIPWSENNIPTLLNEMKANGYISGWMMTTTANIGNVELNSFDVVMIANDQTTGTYNQLKTLDAALTAFVNAGGTLIYGACDHGWSGGDISFDILGSIKKTDCYSMHNYIVDPTHPIVTGALTDDKAITNELLLGTYCSHSGFVASTLPAGYNIILQDSQGNATLAEYPLGDGRVILSGLTWEFYYSRIYTGTTSYSMNVFDDLVAYAVNPVSSCMHKYDNGEVVSATCTTEGYTLHTCFECGATYKDNYEPALGHSMGAWIVDRTPNCTTQGSQHQTCSRCSEEVTSVIPTTAHVVSEWIIDSDPTCTIPGSKHTECTECHTSINVVSIPAYGHTESDWIIGEGATCTSTGSKYTVCTECGKIIRYGTVYMTGHSFVETDRLSATCTENGYVYYACQNDGCGETKKEILHAHGHSFDYDNICEECGFELIIHTHSYSTEIKAPTCTSMGYTTYTCACGYSYNGDFVDPLSHAWDAGTVTEEKTCTRDGKVTYKCKNDGCGAEMEIIIPASHEWSETVTTEATCTSDGYMSKTCNICGEIESEIIPAAHTWGEETEITPANCTEKGSSSHTCTVCQFSETFEIDELGHEFKNGVCVRCGARIPDVVVPSAGSSLYGMYFKIDDIISNYGPEYINEYGVMLDYNKDATLKRVAVYLTQDGTMWRRCIAVVGEGITYATYVPYLSYGEDIKYSGLNSAWINTFSLRENRDGIWCYSDYATIGVNLEDMYGNLLLSLYNIGQAGAETRIFDDLDEMIDWLKYGEQDPSHVHTLGEWTEIAAATCTKSGAERRSCASCDYYEERIISKLAHTGGTATCTTAKTCDVCGVSYGNALGHTPVDDAAVAPTCTSTGLSAGKHCSVCNVILEAQTVVAATGHTEVEIPAVVPTCIEAGSTEGKKCSLCHTVLIAPEVVDALGHDLVHHDAKAPDCTNIGWNAYDTCSRCDYTTYVELSANGHSYAGAVVENRVEPDCTTDGHYDSVIYCSVCNIELSRENNAIDALGHDLVHHDAKAPDCTNIGWNAYDTCSRCDYTTYEEVAELGHSYSLDWSSNSELHWHECICGNKTDMSEHIYNDNGICVCGDERVVETEPETTEPETTEPETTEPETTEPETTEPETTEPETTDPETTEPETTEPETTEPETTEPETTEPETTEPEVTEPETTEPETTEPEVTEPEVTESETTEPETNEPETTEPEIIPETEPSNKNDNNNNKNGCGGMISTGAIVVLVLTALGLVTLKKEDE